MILYPTLKYCLLLYHDMDYLKNLQMHFDRKNVHKYMFIKELPKYSRLNVNNIIRFEINQLSLNTKCCRQPNLLFLLRVFAFIEAIVLG